MIKLICPKCMKTVPVADDFVGTEVTCPNCSNVFPAPTRYTPAVIAEPAPPPPPPIPASQTPAVTVPPILPFAPEPRMSPETASDKPVPPPGFVPPSPPVAPLPHGAPPGLVVPPSLSLSNDMLTPSAGYTHAYGITISPRVVVWMPAVLLTITFFCTFFRWVGSYLGGHPVYSQSVWQAVFAGVSRNFALEKSLQTPTAWLNNLPSDWLLLVPYLLLLGFAAGVAWADRGFRGIDPQRFPPIARFWPWRKALIGVLATLAFLLVSIQLIKGFGMERAILGMVRENGELAKAREAAADKPAELAAIQYQEETEMRRYNIEGTGWQDLALFCNLLAIVTVFLSIPLEKRGNKPPPRIVLHY